MRHRGHFFKKPQSFEKQNDKPTKKEDKNENTKQTTPAKTNGGLALRVIKYAYLMAFFALLSGLFYPFIQGGTIDYTILGIIILFVGLAGAILVYKAATSDKTRGIYIGIGFGLIAISLIFILQFTGRPVF